MALSDICNDFIEELSEGRWFSHREVINQLLIAIVKEKDENGNTAELEALHSAAISAGIAPSSSNAGRSKWIAPLIRLVVLAEQLRAYHDMSPGALVLNAMAKLDSDGAAKENAR